jgi:formyl-CoA transferase
MLRISGYGQDGPRRDEPGFAAIGEAMAGLRYITGHPNEVPVRAGVSLGDTIAGLHGALGVLLALYERDARGGQGQMIDVALYEAVFNLTESLLPEYSAFGAIRQPAGGALPGIAPSNAYRCGDGQYVLIAGNGDSIYKRLMTLIGRVDLGEDPALAHNDGRAKRVSEIDAAINAWTESLTLDQVLKGLLEAEVPSGKIYTAKDIAEDPHYQARGVIETVQAASGLKVQVPGIIPKLSQNPGSIRYRAPTLGEHTDEVLKSAGLTEEQITILKKSGVLA